MNDRMNNKGTILIEALLSVVILSVSITMIIQSMTASLRATEYGVQYTEGLILAENKIFDLMQEGFIGSGLEVENDFEEPFNNYQYEVATDISELVDDDSLNELNLKISWKNGSRANVFHVSTILFNQKEK